MVATYLYDDFHVTFHARVDVGYEVVAVDSTGAQTTGTFDVPLSSSEISGILERLSRSPSRRVSPSTRDIGHVEPPVRDAEVLGGALADALFSSAVGVSYEQDRLRAERAGRGLRLTLSLADAPALLSVPWEFLYRRPRFLASQRDTPVVRLLDSGSVAPPPAVSSVVRILGVIANPVSLPPLDVDAERRGVEQTLSRLSALGRVQLDWLEPATPRRLREALRDGSYHILHYIGHSDFTPEGEGMLFLPELDGSATPVNSTVLANLLDDQDDLRLVVLNSCEGARTTLTDPYAGVATTLIQLGIPAVVAMQFPISDVAAITFGEELYTNLIGRQAPIDAAVAEGRKAIYVEIDPVEWATPVLFIGDRELELFRFALPPAPLPPPGESVDADPTRRRRHRRRLLAATAVGLVAVAAVIAIAAVRRDGAGSVGERSYGFAVQVERSDGGERLWLTDSDLSDAAPMSSTASGDEVEPDWDPASERLAFRSEHSDGACQLCTVTAATSDGSYVTLVEPPGQGSFQHAPTWQARDGQGLFYAATNGCQPGPACAGEIWYVAQADGRTRPDLVETGLRGIRDLDADPWEANRLLVVDDRGASLLFDHHAMLLADSATTTTATFTADGNRIVGIANGDTLRIWDRDANLIAEPTITELVTQYVAEGQATVGLVLDQATARSVSPWVDPSSGPHTDVVLLLDDDDGTTLPSIAVVRIDWQGSQARITELRTVPFSIVNDNQILAVAQ